MAKDHANSRMNLKSCVLCGKPTSGGDQCCSSCRANQDRFLKLEADAIEHAQQARKGTCKRCSWPCTDSDGLCLSCRLKEKEAKRTAETFAKQAVLPPPTADAIQHAQQGRNGICKRCRWPCPDSDKLCVSCRREVNEIVKEKKAKRAAETLAKQYVPPPPTSGDTSFLRTDVSFIVMPIVKVLWFLCKVFLGLCLLFIILANLDKLEEAVTAIFALGVGLALLWSFITMLANTRITGVTFHNVSIDFKQDDSSDDE